MNSVQQKTSKASKMASIAQETLLRRRGEHFLILGAIAELIPRDADVDGRAAGTLSDRDISRHAGVSGKAVVRALLHWQRWRVLWIYWKSSRVRDIRFERAIVEEALATRAANPRKAVAFLTAHKAAREAIAPIPTRNIPLVVQ